MEFECKQRRSTAVHIIFSQAKETQPDGKRFQYSGVVLCNVNDSKKSERYFLFKQENLKEKL